jgi:organic radical activating enzyme
LQAGKEYTAEELFQHALRFREYFGKDGGITLSGGEPLLQAGAAHELFSLCHDASITLALMGTANKDVTFRTASGMTSNFRVNADGVATVWLYSVSALADEFTFTVGEEVYTYSLANYLYEQTNEDVIAKLKGLYNYAYYADLYVEANN